MAAADSKLLNLDHYGESREEIEESWEKWIHHIPFDSPVSGALAERFNQRLEKPNPEKNAAVHQRLKRKRDLARNRADRYNSDVFAAKL